ncbi:hypothetical protein PIB30_083593, partial [Stylosanthes scabra]|nr:hypothetical protein [Stylosanthes scabra]
QWFHYQHPNTIAKLLHQQPPPRSHHLFSRPSNIDIHLLQIWTPTPSKQFQPLTNAEWWSMRAPKLRQVVASSTPFRCFKHRARVRSMLKPERQNRPLYATSTAVPS